MYPPILGLRDGKLQVTKDDCQYTCKDDEGCTTTYSPKGTYYGKTKGSCFPQDFGGACSGIPENCEACNEVVDCKSGSDGQGEGM